MINREIRAGDIVVYRRTKWRAETSGKVEKANRVNLSLVASYQPSSTVAATEVRFKLPRHEVDQVWRDGVLMFDSGRKSSGSSA